MTIKAIIPCAGYGTRMSMQSNQSKEMLTDPVTGKYLIDYSLDLCYSYKIEPIVISRLEKEDLNSYLRSKNVTHISLKEAGKEWAETVLMSQGLWGDKNILILPDTRFDEEGFKSTVDLIKICDLVFATHAIKSYQCNKWGIVTDTHVYEKPDESDLNYQDCEEAWGLIGFEPHIGEEMFKGIAKEKYYGHYGMHQVLLEKFTDITRTGTLEKY